jgi:hypothetical protein
MIQEPGEAKLVTVESKEGDKKTHLSCITQDLGMALNSFLKEVDFGETNA